MNLDLLLANPELASNIRFEIKGSDLLELSSTLIRIAKEQEQISQKETYLTIEEVCKITKRQKGTLWRWAKNKLLVPNQLGLYNKRDVDQFMEKR